MDLDRSAMVTNYYMTVLAARISLLDLRLLGRSKMHVLETALLFVRSAR